MLATIADVFHGALQYTAGAQVHWSRGDFIHITESLNQHRDFNRGRVRVIAQTFSPFSRFPGIELRTPPHISPIYARGHSSEEEYVCIGFNQHSRVDLRHLSRSIVENGIFRLSEQPKVARIAFDVLEELGFKNGVDLIYKANERLSALMRLADDIDGIEKVFDNYLMTGRFIAGGDRFFTRTNDSLMMELKRGHSREIAEYVRVAMQFIREYVDKSTPSRNLNFERFAFSAFRGREGMSSDFPILQSFAFLRRLNFLTLSRCTLTPYSGAPVELTQTSSGQQQMLCSIFGLAAALEDDAIVLIDEPELSLHPRWQMNFFKHLETALEAVVNCHIIIATHSPLIVQAGVAHGAEIIHMDIMTNGHATDLNRERVHSSVEGLLIDVFDTPVPNSLHISNEIFGLVTKAESGTYWEKREALSKLNEYLTIYQRDGDGAAKTTALLQKAIRLVSSATFPLN